MVSVSRGGVVFCGVFFFFAFKQFSRKQLRELILVANQNHKPKHKIKAKYKLVLLKRCSQTSCAYIHQVYIINCTISPPVCCQHSGMKPSSLPIISFHKN